MKYVDELIEKTKGSGRTGEYWVKLYEEIINFLEGDYPEDEKKKLKQKGMLEKVGMLYDGYKYDNFEE
jgi:hypothetical protein